jgi:hypothetical protein
MSTGSRTRWRAGAAVLICAVALLLVATAGAATRLVGTNASNLLVGTKGPDRIVGKGGVDLLKGKGGSDLLIGGRARDGLIGGTGADRLIAGRGNDVLRADDGRRDRLVNGGPGQNACVIDIPADLPVTRNCGDIRAGAAPAGGQGGGGGATDPNALQVTSAQGLLCLPLLGPCLFTITGKGADALVGTVSSGGAITSVTATATNDVILGTWLATGTYNCSAAGGTGWLMVTMGSKSTPQIPVQCG